MAISASTIWNVQVDGNNLNGGAFNAAGSSPGTDRSLQAGPQVTIDGATITATVQATTTTVTLVGHTVTAADNRNTVNVASGGTAGIYEIVSVNTGANQWTFDRVCGTAGQSLVARMGGAHADAAYTQAFRVNSDRGYIKSGTYVVTSTSTNVAGGCISMHKSYAGSDAHFWEGYGTTQGDLGTQPVIQAGGSLGACSLITNATNSGQIVRNIKVDCNNRPSVNGIFMALNSMIDLCTAINVYTGAKGIGITTNQAGVISRCYVEVGAGDSNTIGISAGGAIAYGCEVKAVGACTASALFSVGSPSATPCGGFICCVARGNGQNCKLFVLSNATAVGCIAHDGHSQDGFLLGLRSVASNCIASECGGYGFNFTGVDYAMFGCAAWSNTSGNVAPLGSGHLNVGFLNLAADPFVSAATGDYTLTQDSACRGGGHPTATPSGLTTLRTPDVGLPGGAPAGGGVGPRPFLLGGSYPAPYSGA